MRIALDILQQAAMAPRFEYDLHRSLKGEHGRCQRAVGCWEVRRENWCLEACMSRLVEEESTDRAGIGHGYGASDLPYTEAMHNYLRDNQYRDPRHERCGAANMVGSGHREVRLP